MTVRQLALVLALAMPAACTAAPEQAASAPAATPTLDVVELSAADCAAPAWRPAR